MAKRPQSQPRRLRAYARRQRISAPARSGAHMAGRHGWGAGCRRARPRHELPRCPLRARRGDAPDGRPGRTARPGHRHRDRRRARRRSAARSSHPAAHFQQIAADLLTLEDASWRAFRSDLLPASPHAYAGPRHILEKMAAWTKPGGVVVAQEFDFGAIAVEPTCPPWASSTACSRACSGGHGRNMRAGRQLPAQFEAAGLGTPTAPTPPFTICRWRTWRTC